MPLLDIHLVKGRSEEDVATLLQAVHEAVTEAFGVVERDRYHIVTEHEARHLVMLDTGLGFARSERRVLIHVTSRPRLREAKERFYALLVRNLEVRSNIAPDDVMVSFTENSDADWSFGAGRAQYLNGEL